MTMGSNMIYLLGVELFFLISARNTMDMTKNPQLRGGLFSERQNIFPGWASSADTAKLTFDKMLPHISLQPNVFLLQQIPQFWEAFGYIYIYKSISLICWHDTPFVYCANCHLHLSTMKKKTKVSFLMLSKNRTKVFS